MQRTTPLSCRRLAVAAVLPAVTAVGLAGKEVLNRKDAARILEGRRPGVSVSVTLVRGGNRREVSLKPASRPLWEGIDPKALAAERRRLSAVAHTSKGSFAEYRYQSDKPVPSSFVPVRAEATLTREAERGKTVRFEFHNIPLPQQVRQALR